KPSLSAAQVEEMRNMTASGKNKTAIARHFRISRTTLYRLLAQS
ncbi:helix-turn-helix domain-containing protein, partial [Desulfovibrio sp. OH1186_COT-070]